MGATGSSLYKEMKSRGVQNRDLVDIKNGTGMQHNNMTS